MYVSLLILTLFLVSLDCASITEDGQFYKVGDVLYKQNPSTRGIALKNTQWPKGQVFYKFKKGDFSRKDKKLIREAMDVYEQTSCIVFTQRRREENYVLIQNGTGCNSQVGYQTGVQTMNLQNPFCIDKGTILHELMHVVGFDHEQCRYDRDDYIDIHKDNIDPNFLDAFDKCAKSDSDLLDYPYDFHSVVHYFWNEFAVDETKPTITSKVDGITNDDLGKAQIEHRLSTIDIQKINRYYKCSTNKK